MTARTEAVHLADYTPYPYAIDAIDLDIVLAPTATRVTSTLTITRKADAPAGTPLVLDGDELVFKGALLNNVPLDETSYRATADSFHLLVPPADTFRLIIETEINPDANTQLMGLYRSNATYCTQCEAEGFRRITYYPDRPDVLSVFTTRIEGDTAACPNLLGNGNPVASGTLDHEDRHYAIWHDPHPKPAYLFALVAGHLDVLNDQFTTMSGKPVTLQIYVERGKKHLAGYAMDALKRSMRWDEEVFGREYDLDIFMIVAVSDFNMGAMENKGLNIFNDKYVLADPDTATDQDYANIEAIIAHEYFHNWTGNRITCRDWFQLCLKEGLTVFRDQEFSSDTRSRPVKRIRDVRLLKAHQFPEDGGPLAHPVRPETYKEINNFYTATVYEKGAEVIRMLKTFAGPAGFKAGMDLYFARHDGDAATIEDFLTCFEDASGLDLSQFQRWYAQAGTPDLALSGDYDGETETYRLTIEQTCPPTPGQAVKQPLAIPLKIALIGPDGKDIALTNEQLSHDGVLALTKPRHDFIFSGIAARPVLSVNRGFSAPVTLTANRSDVDHLFLFANDSDAFSRWNAGQTLATRQMLSGYQALGSGKQPSYSAAFTDALAKSLRDETLEPALRAEILNMPSEQDLARDIAGLFDPDLIQQARKAFHYAQANALADDLLKLYEGLVTKEPYSPDAEAAGKRSLRNAALQTLMHHADERFQELAYHQFMSADNMTDKLAALTALAHRDTNYRAEVLERFYQDHRDNALVLDKWLALQAQAPMPETLDAVKALMTHPAFTVSNPNRVRALIGGFANGNQSQFNRKDGAGYRFVAEQVLALDARNPQVAARLLGAFRSWRALEPKRQALAEAALQHIAGQTGLSRDVQDIVERSLS